MESHASHQLYLYSAESSTMVSRLDSRCAARCSWMSLITARYPALSTFHWLRSRSLSGDNATQLLLHTFTSFLLLSLSEGIESRFSKV